MSDCAFCRIGQCEIDEDLVAYRSENVFIVPALKQRPNNPGHALVLPVSHLTDLHGVPPDLLHELIEVTARVTSAVKDAYGATGSTVTQNNHIPGQALHHVHIHVIPRFEDDAFRMPETELHEAPRDIRLARAAALRKALRPRA
ncbi:HIT domain-containing protein [Streptomyces sp. SID8361]|uniref:HIT family protein n=1 Tax=Streptomyces sp. MnatMP-M27 TaxID=1839768 RepID=UPI00081F2911|nr:HIT family protein [Streptomyces sp. MnatMP-M27]MYU10380.1 HIT domain-containing protein [Streptomyces sp. SID8361]SCF71357.1 histidine triad (HIT) family protein [Streptomyces sp. MnatMP-M27]